VVCPREKGIINRFVEIGRSDEEQFGMLSSEQVNARKNRISCPVYIHGVCFQTESSSIRSERFHFI